MHWTNTFATKTSGSDHSQILHELREKKSKWGYSVIHYYYNHNLSLRFMYDIICRKIPVLNTVNYSLLFKQRLSLET